MGVVDANNDDIFDIFTSNHDSLQSLLLGNASERFTDVLAEWKLSQDSTFPGFEDYRFVPPKNAKGFYIYRRSAKALHLDLFKSRSIGSVRGSIVIPANAFGKSLISVISQKHSTVYINDAPWQQGRKVTVQFTIQPGGSLTLSTQLSEVPYFFKLNQPFPIDRVYVGADQTNPRSRRFSIEIQDRHGMAWADYQGDGWMDVFMTRGGLKGKILEFPNAAHIEDQMFVNQGNNLFRDEAQSLGFLKQGCRSRKVAWVDFNQDNRLDLYISGLNSSNLLFQQLPSGKFKNVAPRLKLNFSDSLQFEWLDVDRDHDQDLLIARNEKLNLFKNQNTRFKRQQTIPFPGAMLTKLAIADYDQDKDLDVYAASSTSSRLLMNKSGTFTVKDPRLIGLPTTAKAANWVDIDNDGLLDLHVIPGGVYQQQADHTFRYVRSLSKTFPRSVAFSNPYPNAAAHGSWFDFDNNGTRDLLYAYHEKPPWKVALYRNLNQHNHWLQLKLIGPKDNRQAIGAVAIVTTPQGQQLQPVGSAEGSNFSQGHYRLYFGLGNNPTINSIKIIWGDGTHQTIASPASDQLLTINYPNGL